MKECTIKLFFMRHGEHDKSDGNYDEYSFPLTGKGVKEMYSVKTHINANILQTIGFTANNIRSMQSGIIGMGGGEGCRKNYMEFLKRGRIRPLKELSYVKANDDNQFSRGLLNSIQEKRVMRWTVQCSDILMQQLGYKQSSFSVMAQDVAKILLRYHDILTPWQKISQTYIDKNLYRLFCGKEFIYASFRAKIIELLYGTQGKDAYLNWYENIMEHQSFTRTEVGEIIVQGLFGSTVFKVKDSYGEDIIDKKILELIINEKIL